MIKLSPLFSGSRGNCSLVQSDCCNILLDAGYQYKQIVARLADFGVSPTEIDAIVITHEHGDHIAALPYLTRGFNAAVYAPTAICDYIAQRSYCSDITAIEGSFAVGDVNIDVYECSHDSAVCFGYRFTCGHESVAGVTDTGCVTDKLLEFLSPCKGVMIESNHDVNMLQNGTYPYPLKRRILSNFGHLSNDQTAQVLSQIKGTAIKQIALAHLSEQNNTKELAFNAAVHALSRGGVVEGRDVDLYVADQYCNRITLC